MAVFTLLTPFILARLHTEQSENCSLFDILKFDIGEIINITEMALSTVLLDFLCISATKIFV